ncbi:MAG: ClpXP protease specificity-enhancing factor, partial [Xanthomonadales bacterium]|nr:ClpXP protease specificity-enhancing factor [Xanthomonadales bacterium]
MTPNRPYLLRALYDWIGDNDMTPHILVDAGFPGVEVPDQAVQKGKVILNIDQAAVRDLQLGNDWLTFSARFSGRSFNVSVPVEAVLAIYSKENGQGMMFAQEDGSDSPEDPDG